MGGSIASISILAQGWCDLLKVIWLYLLLLKLLSCELIILLCLCQIPHIFKPEIQFVELSIEQYVPRGKKVKDDNTIQTPVFKDKLTVAESALIAKYFKPEKTWTPSLIAFPRFQAFPSRVHRVMHSYRTTMLIDAMQHLQALSFSRDSRAFFVEVGFYIWCVHIFLL